MIADPLQRAVGTAVIHPEHGSAEHDANVRKRGELFAGAARPFGGRASVDFQPFRQQPSAEPPAKLAGVPAPTNLIVPPYRFVNDSTIVIGADTSGNA